MARQCKQILTSVYDENLDALYGLGGTSGGARPKIMTEINGEDWIIKFPAHVDGADAGEMEYDYGKCAKRCKIHMTETKLFPSKECKGYFGTQRLIELGSLKFRLIKSGFICARWLHYWKSILISQAWIIPS